MVKVSNHIFYILISQKRKKFRVEIFWGAVVPSPKIAMNLPRTYAKLHCKGEPYWLKDERDPLVQTERQTEMLLLFREVDS